MLTDSKRIIERLQRRGTVELINVQDEQLIKMNTAQSVSQFEKMKTSAEQALEILTNTAEIKAPLLAMLEGRKEYEADAFGEKALDTEKTMKIVYDIIALNKRISDNDSQTAKLTASDEVLSNWLSLDLPAEKLKTKNTVSFSGSIQGRVTPEEIYEHLPELCEITVISSNKSQINFTVTCHKEVYSEAYEALRNIGFIEFSCVDGKTPKDLYDENERKISELVLDKENSIEKIKSYADKCDSIKFIIDYFALRIDKYEALNNVALTDNVFVLTGYIPEKKADKLVKELESKFDISVRIFDPEEDEDVPVCLENGRFSSPVESVTEMFSMPNKSDLDPTPIMSFFYYLLFGMMLSDAGYGLLMVIVTSILLSRGKLEDKMKQTMRMFRNCGISTIFWGALFGSWYGDLPQIIAREYFHTTITNIHGVENSTALWFQPTDDPMKLLLFSLIIGICHLFLGLIANFFKLWKAGRKFDAIFDTIPVMLTVLGAAALAGNILTPIPASVTGVAKYVALAGVVLLVLTASRSSKSIFARLFGGVYALYNVATGYLSDILSYSRLLALGLATGSIASVINLMGTMPGNIAVKTIMLILLVVVGHTANIAINLLGAYVHTNRLQFVELFSKFYEGGGRQFSPLKANSKYIKFKEEN